jgi:hypothetical protein
MEASPIILAGVHCKKGYRFSRPQPGCHLPNTHWTGIFKLFPARESLVNDIPLGTGKTITFFYSGHTATLYVRVYHCCCAQAKLKF